MKAKKRPGKKIKGRKKTKKSITRPARNKPVRKDSSVKKSIRPETPRKQETPAPPSRPRKGKNKPADAVIPDLPERYKKTFLRAMPKDPTQIFVYWEITEDTIAAGKAAMGREAFDSAKPVLRLLDITDIIFDGTNAWKYFDTCIHYYANNWYIKIPEPGRTYMIQYGQLTHEGVFYTLMQSNTVETPRDNVCDIIDEEWSAAAHDTIIKSSSYPSLLYERTGYPAQRPYFPGSSNNLIKNIRK